MSGRNPRAGARDMVLTMAVLMIPVLLIVWFFQRTPDEPPLPVVNWQEQVALARKQADFEVLAPASLPDGWRATQASFSQAGGGQGSAYDELRLGFLNADNLNLQVRQAKTSNARAFLTQNTRDGYDSGAQKVGDQVWKQVTSADGRTTYLLGERPDSLVLVSGDTSAATLVAFAGMLTTAG
ncbi:DUF4245 domain-containing protein [Aestuariimicrobium soli]|uniref:DUF4245 domain-containing protein n=1 Tax=Aestuariimicrobium soli TaxID=2035834 RepID=UPI003EBB4CBB